MFAKLLENVSREEKKEKPPMTAETAQKILKSASTSVPNFVTKLLKKAQSLDTMNDKTMSSLRDFLANGISLVLTEHTGFKNMQNFSKCLNILRSREITWRQAIHNLNDKFKYDSNFKPPSLTSFKAELFFLNILSLLKKPLFIAEKYVNALAYQQKELKKTKFVKSVRGMYKQIRSMIRKFSKAYALTGHQLPPKRVRGAQPGKKQAYLTPPPPAKGYDVRPRQDAGRLPRA